MVFPFLLELHTSAAVGFGTGGNATVRERAFKEEIPKFGPRFESRP
jgi:hypothetical protein